MTREVEQFPVDALGREIHAGDYITYPVRFGSSMSVEFGRVIEVEEIPNTYKGTAFQLYVRKEPYEQSRYEGMTIHKQKEFVRLTSYDRSTIVAEESVPVGREIQFDRTPTVYEETA